MMNILNHSTLHSSIKNILAAAGLATAVAASAWAADGTDAEAAARANWRTFLMQNPAPEEGCFHASYPDTTWEKMDCELGQPRFHPMPRKPEGDLEIVGDGNDYVAEATGLITQTAGGFQIKGVKSEVGVGGSGGILGPSEYSLQINTNALETTDACRGHSGCRVWQQFIYAPDAFRKGTAAVFMQYWLINFGTTSCPSGFGHFGSDCFRNSAAVAAPDEPITDLGSLSLVATAKAGGLDSVQFGNGSDFYSVTGNDSVLDISSIWNKSEFNVVGNAGGSQADFNSGSSVTVTIVLFDGSGAAPKCVAHDGTTGETNNLNLGPCSAFSGFFPYIEFTESN
jgi:hypothetical protein